MPTKSTAPIVGRSIASHALAPRPRRSSPGEPERKRRGRPPGLNPKRLAALAEMARAGLTFAEMAAKLGVSRQCIHQQISKYPEIAAERQARRDIRHFVESGRDRCERGILWAENTGAPAHLAMAKFLREALAHGWSVEAAPRRRPRVNGVRMAFHMPRRTRASSPQYGGPGCARYYHVQLTRPDWLHVVCLPTGRYLFFFPDTRRAAGSQYIPQARAHDPQVWPEWPSQTTAESSHKPPQRSLGHLLRKVAKMTSSSGRAWAA
jgi:hypothetical protein